MKVGQIIWVRLRLAGVLMIVLLVLAACGSSTQSQSANASDSGASSTKSLDDLVATDPTTVSLASGHVQFIEFFAYW